MFSLSVIVEAAYYCLKYIGLWDKLLAVHKAKEMQDVQTKDVSLSDRDAIAELQSKYQRD